MADGARTRTALVHRDRVAGTGGISQFGFRFVSGEPYLFCRDPDGYDLEIWYERPTPVDPG